MDSELDQPAQMLTSPPMDQTAAADWGTDIVAAAREVIATHTDQGGFCLGCLNDFSFAVLYPCTKLQWAQRTFIIEGEQL